MNEHLKKQLRYHSWHRGMKEADILLGGFADKYLDQLTPEELIIFEKLLCEKDTDIMDWIFAKSPPPAYVPEGFLEKILLCHRDRGDIV